VARTLWEGTLCPTAAWHRWPVAHRVRSHKGIVRPMDDFLPIVSGDLRRNHLQATESEKSLWEGTLCPTAVRHRWPVAQRVRSHIKSVYAEAIHHRPSLSRFAFITCFAIAPN
jgi:hypothetical protein